MLTVSDKIDKVVTNRIAAIPIFAVIMFLVYFISVSTVGTWATDWANDGVFGDGWHLFGIGSAAYDDAITGYAEEYVWTEEFVSLVESVKSRIMDFILRLDSDGIISLALKKPDSPNTASKIFYQTFNSSVVNNGEGNINADNIYLLSHDSISEKDVQELKTILSRLNVLVKEEKDQMLQEAADSLNQEINSESHKKSVVKKGLAIIKGLAMGVASSEIAMKINEALGVLHR